MFLCFYLVLFDKVIYMFFRRKKNYGQGLVSMVPPWIKYPTIPVTSIGWHVGGEADQYLTEFVCWWKTLEDTQVAAYIEAYPAPPSWKEAHEHWESQRKSSTHKK